MKVSSSTSSSTTSTTSSSSNRLSGLMSGLDTDSIVKQLSAGTQNKIDKLVQDKQLSAWKQTSYREVTSALQEFQTKYLSSSTSSSNISSADFFNTSSITNNNSAYLTLSGNSTNAAKMEITQIKQLAKQASLSSNHKVSTETIKSSQAVGDYSKSTVSGSSITINYGGTDYAITLGSDLNLSDPTTTTSDLTQITAALNAKIATTTGLKGNVSFSVTDDKVSLTTTGSDMYIKTGTSALLSGLGLTASSTTTGTTTTPITGGTTDTSYFFNSSVASGSSLEFTINGTTTTLALSSAVSLAGKNDAESATAIAAALTTAISGNSALTSAGLKVSADTNGVITFSGTNVSLTGGDQNLLQGLGLTYDSGTETYSLSGTASQESLIKTYLVDSLAGSTLSFSLDGTTKTVTFDESSKSSYSTVDDLKTYLQTKLDNVYGSGNVTVGNTDGNLTFSTKNATSTFAVSSSDATGVLGTNGSLHIYAGETNRINTSKTLADISGNLNTGLVLGSDGNYDLSINGKSFSFASTTTIASMISQINGDTDANVTVAYSSTLDTFSVTADSGGANSKVEIKDLNGSNLATALFGKSNAINYDFTGATKTTLKGTTVTVDGTTFEFTNGGSVTGTNNVPVDLSSADSSDAIAAALNTAVTNKTPNYSSTVSGSKVTFTNNSTADYTVATGQNAILTMTLDGNVADATTIERSENKFTLDDVDFNLIKTTDDSTTNASSPLTFTVANATDDLYKKISDFVTDYNSIITLVSGKLTESTKTDGTTYAPLTDDQRASMTETQITAWEKNAKKGILQSDTLLNSLEYGLRDAVTDTVSSVKTALSAIGITESDDYDSYGKLTIDESKLKNALSNNADTVASLFTSSDGGVAARLQTVITKNINVSIGNDGVLIQKAGVASRTYDSSTLGDEMTTDTNKITDLKEQLATEQDRYYSKFTKLESYISTMNSEASLFTSSSSSS